MRLRIGLNRPGLYKHTPQHRPIADHIDVVGNNALNPRKHQRR